MCYSCADENMKSGPIKVCMKKHARPEVQKKDTKEGTKKYRQENKMKNKRKERRIQIYKQTLQTDRTVSYRYTYTQIDRG
jgi:hypothetical protein